MIKAYNLNVYLSNCTFESKILSILPILSIILESYSVQIVFYIILIAIFIEAKNQDLCSDYRTKI